MFLDRPAEHTHKHRHVHMCACTDTCEPEWGTCTEVHKRTHTASLPTHIHARVLCAVHQDPPRHQPFLTIDACLVCICIHVHTPALYPPARF